MSDAPSPIALAMTGASGAAYGLRLLECLVRAGRPIYLMLSKPAQVVIGMETSLALPGRPAEMARFLTEHYRAAPGQIQVFGKEEWTAPVASGSALIGGMVICPCTAGTLASVAAGTSDNLINRAADVALKEGHRLILVVRESPLSAIQLENMLRLARAGAIVMPASPGFYHKPADIQDLVDFMVARILDRLGIEQKLLQPWGRS